MGEPCYIHKAAKAVAHCAVCGRPLCRDCLTVNNNTNYCCVHKYRAMRIMRRAPGVVGEAPPLSPRRWSVAVLLAVVLGIFGVHRLYVGRYASGVFRALLLVVAYFSAVGAGDFAGLWQSGAWNWFGLCLVGGVGAELFFRGFREGLLLRAANTVVSAPKLKATEHLPRLLRDYHDPKPLIPALPLDLASLLSGATLCVALFCLYLMLWNRDPGKRALFLVFAACVSLSGILWCKDLLQLYWNRLTDARGRVLQ